MNTKMQISLDKISIINSAIRGTTTCSVFLIAFQNDTTGNGGLHKNISYGLGCDRNGYHINIKWNHGNNNGLLNQKMIPISFARRDRKRLFLS